ncbi:hypothetical protein LDENG_00023570 [Lucifuga dentata]|nr:hypothetical protein LDENG_00023570 [Lucifuga dentata]
MDSPPTKRLRGHNQLVMDVANDPFGDDEEFTQEDLEEIDIIALQAINQSTVPPRPHGSAWDKPFPPARDATNRSRESVFGFGGSNKGKAGFANKEAVGNGQLFGSDRENSYHLLEAQHAELKRKLKEVEEEIVLKSGEIRVLRDSLKAAQQEKEAQRQAHLLQDRETQKEHSDREKELSRKVQSLQSELQFKEAEINEMKTKLHGSDRGSKTASPLPRNSPKVLSCVTQLHHGSGSSSSSPAGNGFITKESFNSHLPSKTTPAKMAEMARKDDPVVSGSRSTDRQEVSCLDPFLSIRPQQVQHRGGILLALLLQQPLFPSSLGLSHILSINPTHIHSNSSSAGFPLHSDAAAAGSALSPPQSLAVTGLNMLTQNQSRLGTTTRSCPGAVLLLPLLDLHLLHLSQALDSLCSTPGHRPDSSSSVLGLSVSRSAAALGGLEETGFSPVNTGLAALRVLYLLLAHSDEVVEAVLSEESQTSITHNKSNTDQSAAGVGRHSQHALLQSVLRLCDVRLCGSQRDILVHSAMKALCVLVERTPHTLTDRLRRVLHSQVLCVSADSRWQTVVECVCVLRALCDHQPLVQQLWSQHDPCVFLKLFHYIRSRPDKQATHTDWTLLDLEVVRVLSRLTQRAESWTSNNHGNCQCYTELVQTIVVVFHRHWLDLRASQDVTDSGQASWRRWRGAVVSLLRECLMLLHWLLLHHGSFSDSCRPLLHMYDQVIPAVREALRRIPDLTQSEELALDEICRSDGDDMDTDSGC